MWCVLELELAHQRIDAGLSYGVNDTPEYLAFNPNGTVPTIKDGDNPVLWESGAILRYLANTYADDTFWPRQSLEKAAVDMWTEWSKINVALKFTAPVFWPVVRMSASTRDNNAEKRAVQSLEQYLRIADKRLSGSEFLVSDKFTLADIQFAHVLYRYFDIDIERSDLPNLQRYYSSLTQRKTYQAAVMVPYDELRNTL